jgi:hypothetical protein
MWPMMEKNLFLACLLIITAATPTIAASSAPASQQSDAQPASTPVAHRPPYSPFKEIHVDRYCHLLPDPAQVVGQEKPRLRSDPVICHLENVDTSGHMEEAIAGNAMQRNWVSITEQEYLLQNVTTAPVAFVVEQFVPQGWRVDSDPQPTQIVGPTALFRVYAQPGEIVRLHVGLRHTKPLRTKLIKASPLAPAGSASN